MHRMHHSPSLFRLRRRPAVAGAALIAWLFSVHAATADLIRSTPARGYPEIAGNVSGSQTYSYDPVTRTGTFQMSNAPHALELGPRDSGASGPHNPDLIPIQPNPSGRLEQSLTVVLDGEGRLVDRPGNVFEIHGTVVIGDQTYDGVLLEARPTSFGARAPSSSPSRSAVEAFDLNMRITGGKLAGVFGSEAYLRIVPQEDSTFRGVFTSNFSSNQPLTDLRSSGDGLRRPAPVPEPETLFVFVAGGLAVALRRFRRNRRG